MLKKLIILFSLLALSSSCTAEEIKASMPIKDVGNLQMVTASFKPDKHKMKYCGDYLCVIDDSLFFGSDGKIPTTETRRLTFKFKSVDVELDVRGMFDVGVTSENIAQRITVTHYWGDFYKVAGHFSDGAGSYLAQWIVSKDGSIRTHLSDMETAMDIPGMLNR